MTSRANVSDKTRKKVRALLAEAHELADAGMNEYEAAERALVAQTTDVYRALATAAIVDSIRGRRRARARELEREAQARRVAEIEARENSPERIAQRAQYRAELDAITLRAQERLQSRMTEIMSEFESSLRMTWTQELLDSEFVLSDGTTTTWGDATAEQHRDRVTQFTDSAAASIEAAGRHQAAIKTIADSGVSTLREALSVKVSA